MAAAWPVALANNSTDDRELRLANIGAATTNSPHTESAARAMASVRPSHTRRIGLLTHGITHLWTMRRKHCGASSPAVNIRVQLQPAALVRGFDIDDHWIDRNSKRAPLDRAPQPQSRMPSSA